MICKTFRNALSILLVLAVVLSCIPPLSVSAATGPLTGNTGARDILCSELSSQALLYYTGEYSYQSLASLPGRSSPTDSYAATLNNPLYTALHTLMEDTHQVYTIYNGYQELSLATCWLKTDAEAGSDSYLYFYTDRLRSELSSTTLNREHVWPKSKASYYQLNGGADLHHLRPSISSVNLAKSDHSFMDISDDAYGRTTSSIDGEVVLELLKSEGKVEVRDNIKGDIARILLYVYCRWEQPNLYSDVASQNLPTSDSDDSSNKGTRAIEDLDTLLRWCEKDPVDQWEMGRNDQTENVQGNRNVFIDYPELAWLMFGLEPPKDMPTPSGENAAEQCKITVSVNDSNLGSVALDGTEITAIPAQNCELIGYSILSGSAMVEQKGTIFTVTPASDCHIQIQFRKKDMISLEFSGLESLQGYKGDTVTLPQGPTAPEGYSFVGWTTTQVSENTSPGSYLEAGSSYTLTESIRFYALYSHSTQTSLSNGAYTKVTETPTDWSGDYLLVYESGRYAFDGSLSNPNIRGNVRSVSITNHSIPYEAAHSYRVTIEKRSDGSYSLRSASGVYIGCVGNYSGLSYGTSDQYSNRISMNSNATVNITASNGYKLGCFDALKRFQYFSSSSGYGAISLYRRVTTTTATVYTTELPNVCYHSSAEYIARAEPGCETEGTQAYYYCSVCGLAFSDSSFQTIVDPSALILPPRGHSYSYRDQGETHLYYCPLCAFGEVQPHSYTEHLCICGAEDPSDIPLDASIVIRHSLNLASDISINYAVSTTQLSSYDSYYLQCILPEYEGNTLTGSRTVIIEPVLNGYYYYFTLAGITAVNMSDEVCATLFMERDGITYASTEDKYSICTYAYSQLDKESSTDTLKTLCAELLRYGSAAQTYKAYRTNSPADGSMTAVHRSYLCNLDEVPFSTTNAVLKDLSAPSITWVGKSLSLESKVVLRFIMNTAAYEGSIEDLSLHVTYVDYTGSIETVVLTDCTVYDSSSSYYAFDFDGLLAAELRSDVSVAVYSGSTRVSQTMQYNAATYGSNKTGTLRTLCQALLAYSDAAVAQFS